MDEFEYESELRIIAVTDILGTDWFRERIEDICFLYNLELDMKTESKFMKEHHRIIITGPSHMVKKAQEEIEDINR